MKQKGHHYITESYQRGFADANEHVWILTSEGKIFDTNPKNTFKEDHFYTVELLSGGGTLAVEKTLAQIECEFIATIKNRIEKQEPLTEKDRVYVAMFVAAMLTRTKVQREHFRNNFAKLIQRGEEIEKAMRNNPRKIMPLERGDGPSFTLDELKESMTTFDSDESVRTLSLLRDTAPMLAKMRWSILIAPQDKEFVCSDNPFCMCSPERERLYGRQAIGASAGLLDGDVEITFPLTSKYALLSKWENTLPFYIEIPSAIVDQINYRTCRSASNIIASSQEQLIKFIQPT